MGRGPVTPPVVFPPRLRLGAAADRNNLRSFGSQFAKIKQASRSALLHLKPSLQKVTEANWDLGPVVPPHMSNLRMHRPDLKSKMTELAPTYFHIY